MPQSPPRSNSARSLSLSLAALLLASCVSDGSATSPAGVFEGSVLVMWVGEGGRTGDGRFLFVPDPKRPLTFRRPPGAAAAPVIRPHIMYTDGGSIPRAAQFFNGLSPWGYAPAYMIHDWLFVARHCTKDGDSDARFHETKDVSFSDSYRILDEAISALVEARKVADNDVARSAIKAAVSSQIARSLWDRQGACAAEKVKPEDLAAAEAAIPGSSRPRPTGPAPSDTGLTAAVVSRIQF